MGFLFFGILQMLGFWSLRGMVIGAVGAGYLTAYIFKIICCSAIGRDKMPNWPDVTDIYSDIFGPLKSVFVTMFVSFAPAIAVAVVGFWYPVFFFLALPLVAVGAFYFPMALIATAMNTPICFYPAIVFTSIGRVIGPYLAVCGLLVAIGVCDFIVGVVFGVASPIVGAILAGLISFYFTVVEARMLGLIYYCHEKELRWFES